MTMRIYIAGPDLFYRDWPDRAGKALQVCADLGLDGVIPVPAEPLCGSGITCPGDFEGAQRAFQSCLTLLRGCQGIIANLTPFRGPEPDSGTVFEMAVAYMLGLPIVGYSEDDRYPHQILNASRADDGALICEKTNTLIEQFGLPFNLMPACACTVLLHGATFAEAAWRDGGARSH
ncbi:nucleoside 2-deoxyribosyltransferase [Acidithiobacillus ferrivorans]|nr:nucleoside 2-deoxyribosyltransferase [Acidithiobacillus ferrivorans]